MRPFHEIMTVYKLKITFVNPWSTNTTNIAFCRMLKCFEASLTNSVDLGSHCLPVYLL